MKKTSLWNITSRANAQTRTDPTLALYKALCDYPPLKVNRVEQDLHEVRVYVQHGKRELIFSRNGNKKWEV